MHSIITSAILVVVCWLVGQLGLIPLIRKGNDSLGWVALLVIDVPVILRRLGIWRFQEELIVGREVSQNA